jgi:hypothetical protein
MQGKAVLPRLSHAPTKACALVSSHVLIRWLDPFALNDRRTGINPMEKGLMRLSGNNAEYFMDEKIEKWVDKENS